MSWFRRLWNTLRSDRVRRNIDREVSFHIAERADELRAEGLGEDEALRQAWSDADIALDSSGAASDTRAARPGGCDVVVA